jgi:TonB-linked SusC/RagA family outer membrane protein
MKKIVERVCSFYDGHRKKLLIMRNAVLILLISAFQVLATGSYSQTAQLSLKLKDATIKEVLTEIENQSEFYFLYNSELIDVTRKVDISVKNEKVNDILSRLFSDKEVNVSISDRHIVLTPVAEIGAQQQKSVSGKVTDSSNQPLPGVSVVVKGTTIGAVTNADGYYSLSNIPENATLVFSFVGMKAQEIAVGSQTSINVRLEEEPFGIDEVVAIGYGTMKKSDLTGSLSSVKAKNLTAFPTISPQQALQGRAAGIYVLPKNGAPGGEINVRIRGTNSIQGSNEPLYVIDGFPFNGNPSIISNNDIESIEVLKDASATAIYGSRGANGVVLITTKKGKSGKTKIEYDGSYSLKSVRQKLPLMNATEYAQIINKMNVNDGAQPYFANPESFGKGIDWQDQVLQTAPLLNNNISISGGSEKTQFSTGIGYYDEQGIIKGSNYTRFSLRTNISHKISEKLDFSTSSNYSRVNTDPKNSSGGTRGSSLIGGMIGMPGTLTPYNDDGTLRRANLAYPFIADALRNPLNYINEQSNIYSANRLLLNGGFSYKPVKGLSINISAGLENDDNRTDSYTTTKFVNSKGGADINTNALQSFLSENIINYTKTLNKTHDFSVTTGVSYQDYTVKSLGASGSGYVSDVTESFDLGSAASFGTPWSSLSEWKLLSYLGRFNYTLKNRYLFTASFRADGSSRYSDGNKWGYFPSGAFAWKVKEEKFLKDFELITDMKFRLSYGETGSTAISPYQTLNLLRSGKIILNDDLVTTYSPSERMPGPLKWESTAQINIGLDFGMVDNKLKFTADYYIKNTRDLLNNVQMPSSTGYTTTTMNVGEMQNKGLELDVDAILFRSEFSWTVSANIAFNRNTVKKLYEGQIIRGSIIGITVLNDFINILEEGRPLGIFYGYLEDGYDSNGKIKYKDLDGKTGLTFADKVQIGNPNPKFIGGFNSTMTYKNFELSLFFYGSYGNDIYSLGGAAVNMDYLVGLNKTRDVLYDSWTPENPTAKYPKLSKSNPIQISDRFVEDGSFLKLKNIQLSYNFHPKKIGITWIDNGQIYISGQDLLTWTKYSWFDPEVNTFGGPSSVNIGIDHLQYPTSKGVTFGIKLGF